MNENVIPAEGQMWVSRRGDKIKLVVIFSDGTWFFESQTPELLACYIPERTLLKHWRLVETTEE